MSSENAELLPLAKQQGTFIWPVNGDRLTGSLVTVRFKIEKKLYWKIEK